MLAPKAEQFRKICSGKGATAYKMESKTEQYENAHELCKIIIAPKTEHFRLNGAKCGASVWKMESKAEQRRLFHVFYEFFVKNWGLRGRLLPNKSTLSDNVRILQLTRL